MKAWRRSATTASQLEVSLSVGPGLTWHVAWFSGSCQPSSGWIGSIRVNGGAAFTLFSTAPGDRELEGDFIGIAAPGDDVVVSVRGVDVAFNTECGQGTSQHRTVLA